ncbi:ABC transporter substrate-binding protein [Aestuariicoccus sp. MJ-SS9]|uniref:MlaC/ttg2D family ABC transporter substrate-binding protein n=1 Tax=Aestuariicoccus sp. MJ-SS9 TaxID=3079855 RepID=UPI00292D3C27|nr:ABC transporter substrate-binding protein [Aestuariicoccus sp. MJ-SS9]
MTRRNFVACGATLAVAAAAPLPSFALTEGQARAMVDRLVAEINAVIDSGKSEAGMIREFESIFRQYSDTSYVAAYAMGVDGRRATAAQKRAFSKAFNAYVARKYGKRFREFIGGRLEVADVKQVKRHYEVTTIAYLKGEAPFDVTFFVSDRTGKDLFFNMYIEGINMLLTEREEIGAMLDRNRGDIDAMIADLKKAG